MGYRLEIKMVGISIRMEQKLFQSSDLMRKRFKEKPHQKL